MTKHTIFKSRTASVIAGSAVLVTLGGVSGAFAAATITSADIKNGEVKKPDIGADSVGYSELRPGSVGFTTLADQVNEKINSATAPSDPHFSGPNWGLIDRNTIGNGDAYLRSGPSSAIGGVDVAPPSGDGSLGLRTGSAADTVSFGNQVDFVGDRLADVKTVKYSVFTTGENAQTSADNLPNVSVEVDPTGQDQSGPNYSTLVYAPTGDQSKPNQWSQIDASTAQRWYFTGPAGTTSGCNQTTYCTLADAEKAFPDATILSVGVSKGRDNAFVGAVDDLVWGGTTYDFEPYGVKTS